MTDTLARLLLRLTTWSDRRHGPRICAETGHPAAVHVPENDVYVCPRCRETFTTPPDGVKVK